MPDGYCTVEDVRRALRKANLPGDVEQDRDIVIDAIASQTRWLEKTLSRHYYESSGISEDTDNLIPTSTETRDDEHDIPTHGGYVAGAYGGQAGYKSTTGTVFDTSTDAPNPTEQIRLAFGDRDDGTIPAYTRIRLARRDVDTVNSLNIVNEAGGFDDWVASNDYAGGVGTANRGDDWWVRINSGGVSELYIDVDSLDDDIASLSNAVYIDFDYGRAGIPRNVRRGVAFRAGADLVEEAVIEIPQNATVYDIETKADELRTQAMELLEVEGPIGDE